MSQNGFSLLEVIMVMAILAVIFGFGYFVNFDFYRNYALQSEKDTLISLLRRARSQSLNNISRTAHGLYIDASSYTLFYGNSFSGRDAQWDQIASRASGINISGISEVVFQPLSATSTASGTITLTNGTKSLYLDINNEGRINQR